MAGSSDSCHAAHPEQEAVALAGFACEEDWRKESGHSSLGYRTARALWAALRGTGCGSQPAGPRAAQAPALELQVFLQEHS